MKHVFDTDEIAHLWMHKTQSDARNKQGNFYFDGDTIYSYGSPFPIARHVVNRKGEAGILYTTRTYSNTTAKHLWSVKHAIHGNGVPVLEVVNPCDDTKTILRKLGEGITAVQGECFGPTGRFRETKWNELASLIARANEVAEFFGVKQRWQMPESTDAIKEAIAKERTRRERAAKALERSRKIAHDKHVAEQLEALESGREYPQLVRP